MPLVRHATAGLVAALVLSAAPAEAAERPMGRVFDWSHELNQEELPSWDPARAPVVPPARWNRRIDEILTTAGRSGLWFSGFGALPFDVPLHPKEPKAWRTPARFMAEHRRTGLSWDVNLEARAAKNALARGRAVIMNPDTLAPTRRLSLLDPAYRAAALAEIRRLVPRYRGAPYVYAYTGSDEPIAVLPRGAARRSAFARRMAAEVRRRFGWDPPRADARPTRSVREGLRWLAYSRYVSDRFLAMKAEQAALVRRLDPDARVASNDLGFIDGFMPWDYARLGTFADLVEADPYVSYAEAVTPGRGRYNPGFGAKLLADLTGKPVRIVLQAFPYSGYEPQPDDLDAWAAQALRAGATDLSFYALGNPRFTNPPLYRRILDIAARLRGTQLPAAPADPASVVVYATAAEGQGQPGRRGDARYRSSGDALYTTYAVLGELGRSTFVFDSDTRLLAEPERLARARTVWLPRADTLDRPFAEALLAWVRGGGTLIVTDPAAFTRAPDGSSLSDVRDALVGAPLGGRRTGRVLIATPGTLGLGLPADELAVPLAGQEARAFAAVPADAAVVARFIDDAPGVLLRRVGAGQVLAFAADPMVPGALGEPLDLVRLVRDVQRWRGAPVDVPAWGYRVPGTRDPDHPPWPGAQAVPAEAISG